MRIKKISIYFIMNLSSIGFIFGSLFDLRESYSADVTNVKGGSIVFRLSSSERKKLRRGREYNVLRGKQGIVGMVKILSVRGKRGTGKIMKGVVKAGDTIGKRAGEVTEYVLDNTTAEGLMVSTKNINFRINPASILLDSIWIDADFKVNEYLSLGPNIFYSFPVVTTDTSIQSTSALGIGLRADYSFSNGILKSGWFGGISLNYISSSVDVAIKHVSKTFSETGLGLNLLGGYQVFWDRLNLTVGAGIGYGNIPHYRNIFVTAAGFTETFAENPLRGLTPVLEVSLGYAI